MWNHRSSAPLGPLPKKGSSTRISSNNNVKRLLPSPYNTSCFPSKVAGFRSREAVPNYCFVTYAELVGTGCTKLHDYDCSTFSRSDDREKRTTMKLNPAKENDKTTLPTKPGEPRTVSNVWFHKTVAHEQHLGEKAETLHKFPFVLLYFASGNNDDVVEHNLNRQFVMTKRVENSTGDEHSQAGTLPPSKNTKDVDCRQYNRPETNEVIKTSSANNPTAYNEVVTAKTKVSMVLNNTCKNDASAQANRVAAGANTTTNLRWKHPTAELIPPKNEPGWNVKNWSSKKRHVVLRPLVRRIRQKTSRGKTNDPRRRS